MRGPAQAVPVLRDRRVVLGVCGSIAAYKAADLASHLVQAGAQVEVILTAAAQRFVTPLTFQALVHRPVVTDLFAPGSEVAADHVALARRAEALLVAPATADALARLALGIADDALTCTALATRAPLIVAPAMETAMYEHPATREHLDRLRERGAVIVEPEAGRLASGAEGPGRLAERGRIAGTLRWVLGRGGDLAGRRLVVSAGGTREPLDPVRSLTNRSSGKMGHALAAAARDRGAEVVLVTTATPSSEDAVGAEVLRVETARQMLEAIAGAVTAKPPDALLMPAAVADYRPAQVLTAKRRKSGETWTLALVPNPDILSEVRGPFLRVGFAAETGDPLAGAREKLNRKDLDLVVANDVSDPAGGFGSDFNKATLIDRAGRVSDLPLLPKLLLADAILDRVAALLAARDPR